MLQGIADSDLNSDQIREDARRTLKHLQDLRRAEPIDKPGGGNVPGPRPPRPTPTPDPPASGPADPKQLGSTQLSSSSGTLTNPVVADQHAKPDSGALPTSSSAPAARSVIPDFMLQGIVNSDLNDAATRASAQKTLDTSAKFREERQATDKAGATSNQDGTAPKVDSVTSQRLIYTMQGSADDARLPGAWQRDEGSPNASSQDYLVVRTWGNMAIGLNMFDATYGRNGIDGVGGRATASIHYGQGFANAFWTSGTNQVVFGDGNAVLQHFAEVTTLGVHEMTHGLVASTAKFVYQGQSGALDESFSDVAAVVAEQRANFQNVDQASWLFGQGCLGPGINGTALRSLARPGTAYNDPRLGGKDPQPWHMADYNNTKGDNGGVHINSGIPNHAFYQVAKRFGGKSWELAGWLWYLALTSPTVGPNCDFMTFATATYGIAVSELSDKQAGQVFSSWATVGINLKKIKPPDPRTDDMITAGGASGTVEEVGELVLTK